MASQDPNKQDLVRWINDNKGLMVDVDKDVLVKTIEASKDETTKRKKYYDLLESMTWQERVEFLRSSKAQIEEASNSNAKMAILLNTIGSVALRLAPLLLALV